MSQYLKHKVKYVGQWLSSFETELVAIAKAHNACGIICGHIHQAKIENIEGIMYLNSGDWVESATALGYRDGEWQIIKYSSQFSN